MLIMCRRVFPEAKMMLSLFRSMIILDLLEFDLFVNSISCIRAWLMVAYNESDVRVLAIVLKGVDITEVFSPEQSHCRRFVRPQRRIRPFGSKDTGHGCEACHDH